MTTRKPTPANRDAIVSFCQEFLKAGSFTDYCHNGLQVSGRMEVAKIVTGVTFSKRLIDAAIAEKADMVMVHHGIFSKVIPTPPRITGVLRERLKLLLVNDISLCGYHLPLDAHPEIGNNASICKVLGIGKLVPCDVGFVGELKKPMPRMDFVQLVERKLETRTQVVTGGPAVIKRVGVVSGGSSGYYTSALELGADTFICGDLAESVVRQAEESGITLINAGHYNTERFGIQNLGVLVARKFKVPVEYIEVPCEV